MDQQDKKKSLVDKIGNVIRAAAVLIILAGLVYYFISPQ